MRRTLTLWLLSLTGARALRFPERPALLGLRRTAAAASLASLAASGAVAAPPAGAAPPAPPSLLVASGAVAAPLAGAAPPAPPSLLVASLKRSPSAQDAAPSSNGGYFDEVHPEFAVGLAVHWLLWGYAPRPVALFYDFAGVALLAAEGLRA